MPAFSRTAAEGEEGRERRSGSVSRRWNEWAQDAGMLRPTARAMDEDDRALDTLLRSSGLDDTARTVVWASIEERTRKRRRAK